MNLHDLHDQSPSDVLAAIDAIEETIERDGVVTAIGLMIWGDIEREPTQVEILNDLIKAAGKQLVAAHGYDEERLRSGEVVLFCVRDHLMDRDGVRAVRYAVPGPEVMHEVLALASANVRATCAEIRRAVLS